MKKFQIFGFILTFLILIGMFAMYKTVQQVNGNQHSIMVQVIL